jgi:hypothetical protein
MNFFVIKKGHFYEGLSQDSYNKSKLMVKKRDDNDLLDTLKKKSQFQKCEILKLWKFKICTHENYVNIQNFQTSSIVYHI